MSEFIRQAKIERKNYINTNNIVCLQQGSNKLWNAFAYAMEAISGKEIKFHKQITSTAFELANKYKDKNIINLLDHVNTLHIFFYEDESDDYFVLKHFKKALELFTIIRKRYNLY